MDTEKMANTWVTVFLHNEYMSQNDYRISVHTILHNPTLFEPTRPCVKSDKNLKADRYLTVFKQKS